MKISQLITVILAGACIATPAVFAQRMSGGGPQDLGSEQMAKLFGKFDGFTAKAETTVAGKQKREAMQMEVKYAFLKGNVRTEMDMAAMKSASMSPEAVAQMKQMGMDRTITVYRSDKKLMYLIYPGMQAYAEMNPAQFRKKDEPQAEHKAPKMEITKLGEETVDGHPCVKNKITITNDDGVQHEMLAWQATDLKDFAIKTEMQASGSTVTTLFRDIKLTPPEASLFDPPVGYTRYTSMQEMMMSNMQKMIPGMPMRGRGGNE